MRARREPAIARPPPCRASTGCVSHAGRLAFRPTVGERLVGPRATRRRATSSGTRSRDVGGNANRARAWARAARRWPTGAQSDLLDAYRLIEAPTLLLWADEDRRHPLAIAEEALDLLPDAQLRVLPGTGFLMAYDDPVGVARELKAFCRDGRALGFARPHVRAATPGRLLRWGARWTSSGERWTFLILRESFYGVRRFSDMQRNLGIARNILSVAAPDARQLGHPRAAPLPGGAERYEYRLTAPRAATCIRRSSRSCAGATSTSTHASPPVELHHCCGEIADPHARLRALPQAAAPARRHAGRRGRLT